MDDIENRIEKILPALEDRVVMQMRKVERRIDPNDLMGPLALQMGIPDIETMNDMQRATLEETAKFTKSILPIVYKPFLEMDEVQDMAKDGVANILRSMGYATEKDAVLKGRSGNEYYVSVMAPTEKRTLIVDQTVLTSQLMGDWANVQMPGFIQTRKVSIADFFKYVDVALGRKGKPTIYWLHDHKISPELKDRVGFNYRRMIVDMAKAIGRLDDDHDEESYKEMFADPEMKAFMGSLDGMMKSYATDMLKPVADVMSERAPPLSFNVAQTAERFYVPYISTTLIDMLEASTLNPKSKMDSRILKGISLELGLLDFLNPPWPDYVLDAAEKKKSTFEEVSEVLKAAENVGHPSREVEEMAITPRKVIENPAEGIEILEQKNLVIVDQKETYTIGPKGKIYVREIHKKPRVHPLRKAAQWLGERLSIRLPGIEIGSKKKDE